MRHATSRGEWKFTEFRFLIVDFFHLSFACRYCGRLCSKFDRHPPLVPPFYRSLSFFAGPTQRNDKQLTNPILPFGRLKKTSLSFKGQHPLFMVIVESFFSSSKPSKTIIFLWAEISVSDVTEDGCSARASYGHRCLVRSQGDGETKCHETYFRY